ncbi:S8 family serine peptidase [Lacibacter sediminis]|uniref:S8 family peptidase n=1 Tax=Lacibacter sediminis TaxID=2760713 RepID=A0A7G5XCZ4_9BACT|nr:S8 family serine peptidase [Lacibacter sediminis]QNA43347.1 S8 family peptidase [Lacibacter sediminis]
MKNTCYLLFVLSLLFTAVESNGQRTKHVIFFTDKNETTFSLAQPSSYLSARAVARRTKYGIAVDSTDLPVVEKYVDSVRLAGNVTILGRLRWMNAVIIQTNDAAALSKINTFPFVKKRDSIAYRKVNARLIDNKSYNITPYVSTNQRQQQLFADSLNYGNTATQINIHNGAFLHNIGARGQNMQIAFLDGGYFGYLSNPFFDSVRNQNRILATRDFVLNETSVNEDDAHGMACFSIVAGNIPGSYIGSAPYASFYLLRTEDVGSEQLIEEYNWGSGAEYADSAGVDVISSSVGYSTFDDPAYNHSYADMNGNTTIVSRYADLAAKKGMLLVNSAGNEGSKTWKYIVAPADADSVLSVGAVNSSGIIAAFSSFGPTSDGQIKPDVVSVGQGTFLSTSGGTVGTSSGTSFSGPNMAGLATCLWQLFPEFNSYKIIETLRKSADRYTAPHEQYGYGLPDMKKATGILLADLSNSNASITNCTATLQWNSKDLSAMQYIVQRKLPGESTYTNIQTIAAKGSTFSAQNYQYNDVATVAGIIDYRILQVIDTSTAGYRAYAIDSASVTAGSGCNTTNINDPSITIKKVQLFPNPIADNSLQLKFTEQSSGRFLLTVYNTTGQLVYTEQYNKPNGIVTHSFSLNRLAKGSYLLVILKDGHRYAVEEFVKQ